MNKKWNVLLGFMSPVLFFVLCAQVQTIAYAIDDDELREWNNQVRRDKFDILLPEIMREEGVDMWIHVMREAIPDDFGAEELGSTSGVFVFTDRGGDRIERAVLGRRWGATQRGWGEQPDQIDESGAYDIIADPVFVQEPVGGPMSEYDYRFGGLRAFVEVRNPKRIAVNFKENLGPWVTYKGEIDGLSHTDYLLLTKELGDKYTDRIVSSEYLTMKYVTRKVPSEIKLLKRICKDAVERVRKEFDEIVPGVTKTRDTQLTVFRRMRTGLSQRGRSAGWENAVIQGGDIVCSPERGVHAYVLREGETEPPADIRKLYADYLKVEKILADTIRAGRTPREVIKDYTQQFKEAGVILRDNQLHMVSPKNDFPAYAEGFDPEKTQLSIDAHGMMKGARFGREFEYYGGPRIGSLGPDWQKDLPLPSVHHFVMEYFFYVPSPTYNPDEDQYLLFWNHEEALATDRGVEYLSPPQKELYLIK